MLTKEIITDPKDIKVGDIIKAYEIQDEITKVTEDSEGNIIIHLRYYRGTFQLAYYMPVGDLLQVYRYVDYEVEYEKFKDNYKRIHIFNYGLSKN